MIEQPGVVVVISAEEDDLSPLERADLQPLHPLLIGRAAAALAPALGGTALPGDLEAATVRAASLARRSSPRSGDATSPGER